MVLVPALAVLHWAAAALAASAGGDQGGRQWIGTWAAAPQPSMPGDVQSFRNQSLRLIVHTSAGGTKVRVRISNTYGEHPLLIGGAHIARRAAEADIDPGSDRALVFQGRSSTTVPARSMVVSDPVELDVPALSDLAISLYFPEATQAKTTHVMAKQTSYVSAETGDSTAAVKFPVARKISSWPFLTGVDVEASARGFAIVALGSSLTDGDGSTKDANRRWPDVLAERLQKAAGGKAEIGVLNEGIIGNRLLSDSPKQPDFIFGAALGEAGLARLDRDVLGQAAARFVFVAIGVNDILFPGSFTAAAERIRAQDLISGYRLLIKRAHEKGIRVIGTTIPPYENAFFKDPPLKFYTPENEAVRQEVNRWILGGADFDAVVDFDLPVRDPSRPTQLLPEFDAGDHLHVNDAGYSATANVIPLSLFAAASERRSSD